MIGFASRRYGFKVGNPHTVEDLSGEVFVRVIEGLKKGYAWRESPQAWIMGIARNVVVDHYRKQEKMTEVNLDERLVAAQETDPNYRTIMNEEQAQLKQAINQLTDEQRDVILMRFMEGIDINSVAEALNKTPGAIKGLQFRALRALAEILGEVPEDAAGAQNDRKQ